MLGKNGRNILPPHLWKTKDRFFFWGGEGKKISVNHDFPPPFFFLRSVDFHPGTKKEDISILSNRFSPSFFLLFYLGVTFELYQKFRGERCEAALDLFLLFPRFSVLSPSQARRGFRKKYFSSFAKAIFNDEANLANRKRKKKSFLSFSSRH